MFAKRDAQGHLIKRAYGPGILKVFGVLAELKFLRGSALDIFGYTSERRTERELIREYRANILAILPKLNRSNLDQALALASLPEEIRGYSHIKETSLTLAVGRRAALMNGSSAQVVPLKDSKMRILLEEQSLLSGVAMKNAPKVGSVSTFWGAVHGGKGLSAKTSEYR